MDLMVTISLVSFENSRPYDTVTNESLTCHLPHMDGSVVFARSRQCAPPSNICFLEDTPLSSPNGISIGSAAFCTAHGTESILFTKGRPFLPQNCPFAWVNLHPIYYMVPWAHMSPQPKWYLDWFSRFCRAYDHDQQTDHVTPSVTTRRNNVVMCPKNRQCHADRKVPLQAFDCVAHLDRGTIQNSNLCRWTVQQ